MKMSDDVLSVRTSQDNKYLVAALLDNTIKIFFAGPTLFPLPSSLLLLPLPPPLSSPLTFVPHSHLSLSLPFPPFFLSFSFLDTLKFYLSLYGHKLPVLALDVSSDGTLVVSGSSDKNVKIWGTDFGDCHKFVISMLIFIYIFLLFLFLLSFFLFITFIPFCGFLLV